MVAVYLSKKLLDSLQKCVNLSQMINKLGCLPYSVHRYLAKWWTSWQMLQDILRFCRAPGHKLMKISPIGEERWFYSDNTNYHKKLLMPQSYRGYPTKLGKKHWLQQTRSQNATGKNGSILSYFFRFPLQKMHGIHCHVSVFLIRPTPAHYNTLHEDINFSIYEPWQCW